MPFFRSCYSAIFLEEEKYQGWKTHSALISNIEVRPDGPPCKSTVKKELNNEKKIY
jgi:hypothetical protein